MSKLEKTTKFQSLLTLNGKQLLSKRAENLSMDVEEAFSDQKRVAQKKLRKIDSEIATMEDMSVKSTDSLVVGEGMDVDNWVKKRIELELTRRDTEIELKVIRDLMEEYFAEEDEEE